MDWIERLENKGWTSDEIEKVNKIIIESKEKKSSKIVLLDSIIYWIALILIILGNMVISIVLIPFLFALRDLLLYIIIITLGLVFGLLFDLLIRDIDNLGKHHYIIAGLFIPSLAIINVIYMANFANKLIASINLNNTHQPLLVGAVYTIAFTCPYLFSHIIEGHQSLRKKIS